MKLPDDGFHCQWKRKLISSLCERTLPFQLQLSHFWWFGRLFYNVTLHTGMSEWLNRSCSFWALSVATLSYSSPVNLRHLTCLLCCHLFYLAAQKRFSPSLSVSCCLTSTEKEVPRDVQLNLIHCPCHGETLWMPRKCGGKTEHLQISQIPNINIFLFYLLPDQTQRHSSVYVL